MTKAELEEKLAAEFPFPDFDKIIDFKKGRVSMTALQDYHNQEIRYVLAFIESYAAERFSDLEQKLLSRAQQVANDPEESDIHKIRPRDRDGVAYILGLQFAATLIHQSTEEERE